MYMKVDNIIMPPETLEKLIDTLTECFTVECQVYNKESETASFDMARSMLKVIIKTCFDRYNAVADREDRSIEYAFIVSRAGRDMLESYCCGCVRTRHYIDLITDSFYKRRKTYDALQNSIDSFFMHAAIYASESGNNMYNAAIEYLQHTYEENTAADWRIILENIQQDIDELKEFIANNK